MKVVVLPQKLHESEIHTVDINASNELVATGGKDLAVNIWKLLDLATTGSVNKDALERIAPQQKIEIHNSTVTLIKWSPTRNLVFISGNLRGQLFTYNIDDNTSRLVFPWPAIQEKQSVSIIDGGWSSDGRLFAWSTLDGKVHLLDTQKDTYQELTNNANEGKVTIQRSIAFDPTNNYFITVGDDSFVTVYQYHYDSTGKYQFRVVSKISKLMNNNATVTSGINYRRVSWSSDGEYFTVPNASKQLSALISLLSRSLGWGNKISLVGHDLECDVVRFAPRIFQGNPPSPHTPADQYNLFHVIASAGTDKSLVVWNTTKDTPLFVLRDTVAKPIVDLAWDKSSSKLIFVSLDGHIGVVLFEPQELGFIANEDIVNKLKESQKLFIKPFVQKSDLDTLSAKRSKSLSEIIDEDTALKLEEAFSLKEKKTEEKPDQDDSAPGDTTKKLEANSVGDITPVVLSASENIAENEDILSSAMTERSKLTEAGETAQRATRKAPVKAAAKTQNTSSQKITTKDGKKRIQPVLISNGQNASPGNLSAVLSNSRSLANNNQEAKSLMEFDKPSYSVLEELLKEGKRQRAQDESGTNKKFKRDLEPVKFVGSVIVNPSTTFAKVRLSVPKTRMSFRLTSRSPGSSFVLDIKNGQGNETVPSRITYFKNELQIWCDFIPRYIQLAAEGDNFWAVSTADGQIITYSHTSGRRFLPPIVLGSPLSFLECHSKYLMAVTSLAEIYVWDMEQKKLHLSSPLSLATLLDLNNKFQEDVLSKADNITMCSITSKGIPLVTISNGSGYLYNMDLGTWHTVSEAWWAFGSHYWDSITDDKMSSEPKMAKILGKEEESSILGLLEHKTNEEILRKSRIGRGKYFNKISKNMIMKEGFENLENNISISHLENRILCCELLGEKKDFHDFMITYTKRICELGLMAKLFDTCQQLLEPEEDSPGVANGQKSDLICGYDRRDLLKEIILSCAESRDAQRILVHFSKKLGMIESEYQ